MRVNHRVSAPYHPQTNGNFIMFTIYTIYRSIVKTCHINYFLYTYNDNSITFAGMVEKLNSTVISALKACTLTEDWVNCLQSVAMSIRSQPHESTGLSPYEMMFGVPMRLPMELEDGDIPEKATQTELAHIMPQPPQGHDGAKIFQSVDKIRQIIHNSASGNISKAKTKQAFYFEQRHRGIPNWRQSTPLQQKGWSAYGRQIGRLLARTLYYSGDEWETEVPSDRQ